MGTVIWKGNAQDVAQVNTHTIGGTAANGQVYTITINTKTVTYTADGSDDNDSIAAALQALLAASTIPEFAEVTWTVAAAVITGTAATAGVPFTATSGATGTGTLVAATSTAATGKNFWDNVNNWDTGAVPVDADDVYLENSAVSVLYGLSQSSIDLASLNIAASFTGTVGLPDTNPLGYREYRTTYLTLGTATALNVGSGPGSGSGRLRISVGSNACTATVNGTAQGLDSNVPALLLKGTSASNVLNANRGSIGVAFLAGETATLATVRVGSRGSPATDVALDLGSGCTLTTVTQAGGTVTARSNVTTWNLSAGTAELLGTATLTTANLDGGTLYYSTSGTLTTANVRTGAALDFSRDLRARTVTNCTLQATAALSDSQRVAVFTNGISLSGCTNAEVSLDLGANINIARTNL